LGDGSRDTDDRFGVHGRTCGRCHGVNHHLLQHGVGEALQPTERVDLRCFAVGLPAFEVLDRETLRVGLVDQRVVRFAQQD
jgi:hypothetical protein